MAADEVRVARTGREAQRYKDGCRLVAGCVPYRMRVRAEGEEPAAQSAADVEVLMISSRRGPGMLFPKGGWETDETAEEAATREAMEEAGVLGEVQEPLGTFTFSSKRQRSKHNPEGCCEAHVFVLLVRTQLDTWPEQSSRKRVWMPIGEAIENCRHDWIEDALRRFRTRIPQLLSDFPVAVVPPSLLAA
eukprot:TRINITY_DN4771_c0_g1_i1.p1 TRINITY_DN4771_c0_g1~~TRINITY_DN4771_c0_g1_i1.p1  ORF type:complete len:190 (+),score=38.86 TRINITY_DN4771_c0_g1_i1:358-927(+)